MAPSVSCTPGPNSTLMHLRYRARLLLAFPLFFFTPFFCHPRYSRLYFKGGFATKARALHRMQILCRCGSLAVRMICSFAGLATDARDIEEVELPIVDEYVTPPPARRSVDRSPPPAPRVTPVARGSVSPRRTLFGNAALEYYNDVIETRIGNPFVLGPPPFPNL